MANRSVGSLVTAAIYNEDTFDIGDLKYSAKRTPTTGWLKADGSAVSRTTYATLFAAIVNSLGTVTVTIASPGVFTLNSHGLFVGDTIYLTTTGALPTGLAANTLYYVVSVPTANTFQVSATSGGSAINTSGSQSGVHTLWYCPYGLGDGSTTFNLPDARGRVAVAAAGTGGHNDVAALAPNDAVALANRRPSHHHTYTSPGSVVAAYAGGGTGAVQGTTGQSTSGGTPVDAPSYFVLNAFVKYA